MKSDKEGEISYYTPYMWILKRNDINELMVAGGERIVREFGKVMYTLLCSQWIIKKDLLYSKRN